MLLAFLIACRSTPTPQAPSLVEPDFSNHAFPVDRVVEVGITMPPEDWEACRNQTRSVWDTFGGDCLGQPFESPFSWFTGAVTMDGVEYAEVGIKKKGFLGSLDTVKPGLKVRFDKYEPGASFHDLHKIALNNAPQDPTMLHTCLAYTVFARAGLPAPRCGFAHVTVNEEDLGIYALVEPIDDEFVARRFPGEVGSLYEGTISDFRDEWMDTFEGETDAADGTDLVAVKDALSEADDDVIPAIEAVIDLDAYYDFWAAEALVGHWDGYAGNTNNFYVYRAPATGRIHFLPWGVDSAFDSNKPFGAGAPVWVIATAALPNRLIHLPEGEAAYREHMSALLARAWDEEAMLAEVDRMAALVAPYMDDTWEASVDDLRDVVSKKLRKITNGMEDDLALSSDLRGTPCLVDVGTVSGTFDGAWGTYPDADPFSTGVSAFEIAYQDQPISVPVAGAVAGDADGTGIVMLAGLTTDGSTQMIPYVSLSPDLLVGGTEVPLDFTAATGALYYMNADTGGEYVMGAYIADGSIRFDAGGSGQGDAVRGAIEGKLVAFGW